MLIFLGGILVGLAGGYAVATWLASLIGGKTVTAQLAAEDKLALIEVRAAVSRIEGLLHIGTKS